MSEAKRSARLLRYAPFVVVAGLLLVAVAQLPAGEPRYGGKPLLLGSTAALKWPSVVGRVYRVQYKDDLTTSGWTDANGEISATKTNVAITVSAGSTKRFYRVTQVR